ncbi:MAG TPA: glycosyltransferase family 39 protein [Thermoanaerobaculia bacterium]
MTAGWPERGRRWGGEAVGLGLFAAVQTFVFFARRDRFPVLFWFTSETWLFVVLLWAKDLALASAAFFVFAWIAGSTLALPEPAQSERPGSRVRHALFAAAILAAGVALRWIAPRQIPPGAWADVLYEAEGALREPGRIPLAGGRPLDIEGGGNNSTLVSNLYLNYCSLILRVFGPGDAGVLALSAVGGTFSLLAVYWAAREIGGRRRALIAAALLAFGAWPLIFSRWGWTLALLLPLLFGAVAAALAALRTRKIAYSGAAGALAGLSLHTHPTAWAAAAGLGTFALLVARDRQHRRLVAAAALGCVLAFLPYGLGFLEYPQRIGGRTRDIPLLGPSKDATIPGASGPFAVPTRLLHNAVQHTGVLLWTSDPNPRHGLPGRPQVHPVIGIAALAGAAIGWRLARRGNKGELLLWLIVGATLPTGLLVSPGGVPNTLRIFPVVGAIAVWSASAFDRWIPAAARALSVRVRFAWALGLTLVFLGETIPFLTVWPENRLVVSSFCVEESAAGRLRRALGTAPTVLDPKAVRCRLCFETLASSGDRRAPVRRLPRRTVGDLASAAPAGPFWYVTTRHGLAALRAIGFVAARGVPVSTEGDVVISWVRRPPERPPPIQGVRGTARSLAETTRTNS